MEALCVVGVDLAGVPTRPTGVCTLQGTRATTCVLHCDDEILAYVKDAACDIVAIDAPLTLPPGRRSIEDNNGVHFRACDEELRRRKIRFFPITLGPMRSLTWRGMMVRECLESFGVRVIEIYPGGAQDVWGIPRQQHDLVGLRRGLSSMGISGLYDGMTGHELDAVTGALVGRIFLQGRAEVYGDFTYGAIVMPRAIRAKAQRHRVKGKA